MKRVYLLLVVLFVFFSVSAQVHMISPADGAIDVSVKPTLVYHKTQQPDNTTNTIVISPAPWGDPNYRETVYHVPATDTVFTIPSPLLPKKTYYWIISNTDWPNFFSFTTGIAPLSPIGNVSTTHDNEFIWASKSCDSYTIQISLNSDFSSIFYEVTTTDTTAIVPSTIDKGVRYYWRLRSTTSSTPSEWSPVYDFIKIIPGSTSQIEITDYDHIVTVPTTLQWYKAIDADLYHIQLGIIDFSGDFILADEQLTTDTIYTFGNNICTKRMDYNRSYNYRIRSVYHAATETGYSDWTPCNGFSTELQPTITTPVPVSPANNTVNQTFPITLTWTKSTNAKSYTLFIDGSESAGCLTDTTFTIPSLAYSQAYTWKVAANLYDLDTKESDTYTFTTMNQPEIAAPTLIYPSNNATNQPLNPTLTWNKIIDATGYIVTLDGLFSEFTTDTVRPVSGLIYSQSYTWSVISVMGTIDSTASATHNFTTIPKPEIAAPTLTAPANNALNQPLSLTLTWNPVTSATGYIVTLNGLFSEFTTNTIRNVSGLVYNQSYTWTVTSVMGTTDSTISSISTFTTGAKPEIAAPTLVSPANNSTGQDNSLSLKWNRVVGASGYIVTLNDLFSEFIADTARPLSGLIYNKNYSWKVMSVLSNLDSTESSVYSFTTAPKPEIAAPTPTSPVDGVTDQDTALALTWSAVTGATGYIVTFNGGTPSFTTSTSVTVEGLAHYTTYTWKVASVLSSIDTTESPVWSFITKPADVTSTIIKNHAIRIIRIPDKGYNMLGRKIILDQNLSKSCVIRISKLNREKALEMRNSHGN